MKIGRRKSQDKIDTKVYLGLLGNVLEDAHAYFPEIPSCRFTRDRMSLKKRCDCEGFQFLSKSLPKLGKAFDRSLETGRLIVPDSFGHWSKGLVRWNIPKLFSELFSLVFTSTGSLRRDVDVAAVGFIRQLCYLCYKVEVPHNPDSVDETLSRFVETERELQTISARCRDVSVCDQPCARIRGDRSACAISESDNAAESTTFDSISRDGNGRRHDRVVVSSDATYDPTCVFIARLILSRLFRGFNPYEIVPRHGPGAVADRRRGRSKYGIYYYSPKVGSAYHYCRFATFGNLSQDPVDLAGYTTLPRETPKARVVCVPKDSRGPRIISCEPALLQFLQQGLSRKIVDWVEKHPLTKGKVLFNDQTIHRRLALTGSASDNVGEDHGYVTLDLKDASDRLTMDLVEKIFPDHLAHCLNAIRSEVTVLPDGREVKLLKHAPMGSAVCFPIMAISFWALSCAAIWQHEASRESNWWNAIAAKDLVGRRSSRRFPVWVYGDDIITTRRYAKSVVQTLTSHGLKFNMDKCFMRGKFRESCGCDAFDGIDVTPVKIRALMLRVPKRNLMNLYRLSENARAFFDKGYWRSAEYLWSLIEGELGLLPVTSPSFSGISRTSAVLPTRWLHPGANHLRWNRSLQRIEVKTTVFRARREYSPFEKEVHRLFHDLTQGMVQPYSDSVAVPRSAKPKAGWVALR